MSGLLYRVVHHLFSYSADLCITKYVIPAAAAAITTAPTPHRTYLVVLDISSVVVLLDAVFSDMVSSYVVVCYLEDTSYSYLTHTLYILIKR